jgi:hypothetical protein
MRAVSSDRQKFWPPPLLRRKRKKIHTVKGRAADHLMQLLVILTQAYGGMLASIWHREGAAMRRRYACPIAMPVI